MSKISTRRHLWLLLAGSIISFGGIVTAQPSDAVAPSVGDEAKPSSSLVSSAIRISKAAHVPNGLYGTIEIRNNSKDSTIAVSSFKITPSSQLAGIYGQVEKTQKNEITIARESAKIIPIELPVTRRPTIFEHISFRTGPSEFIVHVNYADKEQATLNEAQMTTEAEITTSNLYVVWGGICGGLVLILFTMSSKLVALADKNAIASLAPRRKELLFKWSLILVAYALNGLIVALILVLLSSGLNAFALPISFKLQDFTGGVIVGLFSVTLAKFVTEKITPK